MITRYFIAALISLACMPATAQLCQGSLGDPLVNISFGSGTNPGAPLAAAATGYQFVFGDCPGDGFYTVRSNTNSCFGNSWHSLSTDHTGNGNGYFMLVNASLQPSAFYVDTVKGLCGNSTYEFAAWVMNVILPASCNGNANQPNLSFTIEKTDGTVLQTYNSGNIASSLFPSWKQYGFFFTTPPAGSDIVLRIVNNAPGGCGNDLALDDITFRPCGPQLNLSITGQTTDTADICEGTVASFNFSATISAGFTNPVFQWQQRFNNNTWADIPGANSTTLTRPFISSSAAGNYGYRLSVAEAGNLGSTSCRISSIPVTVIIHAKAIATATNTGPVCKGSSITLTGSGGTQYLWTGPNGYTANTASATINRVTAMNAGIYTLRVSNAASCSSLATTTVLINPSPVAAVGFTDTAFCIGNAVQLSASGGSRYQWFPAEELDASNIFNPTAAPLADTRYRVVVYDAIACTDTAYINVKVYHKAIANAGPDKTIVGGGSILLSGSITGSYLSFNWSPVTGLTNAQTLQPIANPVADAEYILTAISNNGCGISTDTMAVKLYTGIFIPNAFTPNGDGTNDFWNIPALDAYPDFELYVFNRYGQLVFKNSRTNQPWDGKFRSTLLPTGAYPYLIKLTAAGQILKGMVLIIH